MWKNIAVFSLAVRIRAGRCLAFCRPQKVLHLGRHNSSRSRALFFKHEGEWFSFLPGYMLRLLLLFDWALLCGVAQCGVFSTLSTFIFEFSEPRAHFGCPTGFVWHCILPVTPLWGLSHVTQDAPQLLLDTFHSVLCGNRRDRFSFGYFSCQVLFPNSNYPTHFLSKSKFFE